MDLWQVDVLKWVAYPPNPDGRYYWTSVYYVDRDQFSSAGNARNFCLSLDESLTTQDVWHAGLRVHDPPGRGNVIFNQIFTSFDNGLIPSEGSWSMINIARWSLRSSTGRYSYRLNRMPLRPSDMDGDRLSASGIALQEAGLNTFLIPARCRNQYGELLVSGEVVPTLVKWQLRHGTKRRQRNPLA